MDKIIYNGYIEISRDNLIYIYWLYMMYVIKVNKVLLHLVVWYLLWQSQLCWWLTPLNSNIYKFSLYFHVPCLSPHVYSYKSSMPYHKIHHRTFYPMHTVYYIYFHRGLTCEVLYRSFITSHKQDIHSWSHMTLIFDLMPIIT